MTSLLSATGLVKAFNGMRAVDDVDLGIVEGRVTGIIGPNGAGKTTLVHVLTGQLLPDSGRIEFDGAEITTSPADARVRRGLCRSFQIVDVFGRLTVFQNIQIARITHHDRNRRFFTSSAAESTDEVEAALNEVGLWDLRLRQADQLSHGQQRRLDLALTLATDPRLCFLDEPTSGVSPHERDQMLELIKGLAEARRATFVVIEHDMEVVFGLCDWIVVMHRGAILAQGTPEEIQQNREVREVYLGEEV